MYMREIRFAAALMSGCVQSGHTYACVYSRAGYCTAFSFSFDARSPPEEDLCFIMKQRCMQTALHNVYNRFAS